METFDLNIYKLYQEEEHKVYAYKCPSCKTLYHPAPMICKKCHTRRDPSNVFFSEWDKVVLQGKCKLLTWTRVYALPEGYEIPYLDFGIVQFKNGIKASGRLRVENPKNGMDLNAKVDVIRKEGTNPVYGLIFQK